MKNNLINQTNGVFVSRYDFFNGKRVEKKSKIEYDFFLNSTVKDKITIYNSSFKSTALWKGIYTCTGNVSMRLIQHITSELEYQINNSEMLTGVKVYKSKKEIELYATTIIERALPSLKWMSKQQFTIILVRGFLSDFTKYNNFSIKNFIAWAKAYNEEIKPVLLKQTQYEYLKKEEKNTKLLHEISKEEKTKIQLKMLKSILTNSYAYLGKEVNSRLKKVFAIELKRYWYRNGYNFDLAYDFLIEKEIIDTNQKELIEKDFKTGNAVFDKFKKSAPKHISEKFDLIYSKNDYMIKMINELLANGRNIEFANKFEI